MNSRKLKTLYKKEIMDVLRDKKTILTMVVLPLVLYPVLFLVVMQVITMINTKQQERTYHVSYDKVADEDRIALNDWMKSSDNKLKYKIKEVESTNPKKDLNDEVIDAYITTEEKNGQMIYQVHCLSAVTNSSTVSGMLEKEINTYANHLAEEEIKDLGYDVKSFLHPVAYVEKDHSSSESSMGSILGGIIPFLMITAILMGAMYPAIDATAGEKERGTLETMLTLPVGNMELIMSKFLSVATLAIVSVFFNVLSMGAIAVYMYTTLNFMSEEAGAFQLGTFVPAILICIVCIMAFALFVSALVMCVCSFAKSFKEANNYITPLTLVVILTGYIGFIPNVELSSKTALIPVANICLLIKQLLVFKYDFSVIMIVLLSNVVYAFVAVWFLAKVYSSESILFGESLGDVKIFEKRRNIKKGSIPSIPEAIFVLIVALLLMNYIGGLVSIKSVVIGVVVQQLFVAGLPILVAIYIKSDIKEIFGFQKIKLKHIFAAVVFYLGIGSLTMGLSSWLSSLFPSNSQDVTDLYTSILDGVPFVGALFLIAFMPAICEEILYRGFILSAFKSKLPLLHAILWTSLLFGISHMSIIKIIPTMLLGMGLAYARTKSNSMIASSIMHFLNNGLVVVIMYYGSKISFLDSDHFTTPMIVGVVVLSVVCIPLGMVLFSQGKEKLEKEEA